MAGINKFEVRLSWIEENVEEVEWPKEKDTKVELDTSRADKQEMIELTKCLICTNVAWNPKQCETCGTAFCEKCISQVKSKNCPYCQKKN